MLASVSFEFMEMLGHRFFRYFPGGHARHLARSPLRGTYPPRRIIFEENDPSGAIYLVLSGRVQILKRTRGEHFQTLALVDENDFFGELGVLDGSGRSARAMTETEVEAAILPRPAVLATLARCPWKTTLGLCRHVIASLRDTDTHFVQALIRKEKITLIGEMANSILHDFRSPVTSIRLALGAVGKYHQDDATRSACETIDRQLRRMSSMVEEVLEYARGESRLDRRAVPLRELFADLLAYNRDLLRDSGVTVRVRAMNLTAVLDHDRMLRVLQNLLINAMDALAGRKNGVITLAARRGRNACDITVQDNGPGIPKVIWETIFQPFTSHGKRGGTGLGLAIAKGIVDAHGGAITFVSRRGVGTTFHIRLPLPE